MFTVTKDWLHRYPHKPPAGWTAKQLRLLGIAWPPKKGWIEEIEGKQILDRVAREFESLAMPRSVEDQEREELLAMSQMQLVEEVVRLRGKLKAIEELL